jgi:hypothetical protein
MWKKLLSMLYVSLAILAADSSDSSGRTSGRVRAASDIDAIVIHAIGGPACAGHSVVFQAIPFREDDAEFWRIFLLNAAEAGAHYVVGRDGKVVEAIKLIHVPFIIRPNATIELEVPSWNIHGNHDLASYIEHVHRLKRSGQFVKKYR